ncbi:HypC/HybG/HupF family hydrogenase formation chaperone [Candidatus Micrarchaeota archaeon]|nr:HypC/HybG/HupF family hydrogenase formation chaperone [Candidatus Micrarchaeota archaeon]MBU1929973.1 HypC/HybG/HupF family hydrogenase formation chaperone [Candidatus Micrarchaeota archaeon]
MCLAIPGQIIEVQGVFAIVQIGSIKRKIPNLAQAKIGEWVLVESGIASEKLEKQETELMVKAWSTKKKKKKKVLCRTIA